MIRFALPFLALSLLFSPAIAQDPAPEPEAATEQDKAPMPETLVIGYEDEGKVEATDKVCRAFVVDMVEWDKAEMEQAVKDVCAQRQKHIDAYAKLQAAYSDFRAVISEQTRFDGAAAARHISALIKNCIDMKWALSTGGHNIGTDLVPNFIATTCLDLGHDLLQKETETFTSQDGPQSGGD
jgi:hypothetical protein